MYLSPTEEDRLRIFTAAELARRALARGLKLNAPEAIALTCDEMHMAARAGASFDEVLKVGRRAVGADRLILGVSDLVEEIRLEVLLDEGSRLVVLRSPWRRVEDDHVGDGDGPVWGYAKNFRSRMSQFDRATAESELDMLLAGVLVIDPVLGVMKTNIGVKDGRIVGVGRAGNPDITSGV